MLWEIARDLNNPFSAYAFVALYSTGAELEEYVAALDAFLANQKNTPLKEQLMWLRAQSAFHISVQDSSLLSSKTLYSYYEELILTFPSSFYSPLARIALNDLNFPS